MPGIIYKTKTRFFVASDIEDYVRWLGKNYVDPRSELIKRNKGTTTGCRKVSGSNNLNLKRYNYNILRN